MSFYVASSLLLVVLLSIGDCEDRHHHHNDDDNWPSIISQVEVFWKSTTASPTVKELTEPQIKGHHWISQKAEDFTTESPTTVLIQNGTFIDGVKDTFRASLALLVGVPIFGVLFLCCLCYFCCKCCGLCCESEEKGQVIVMQQNNVPQPQPQLPPQQIIVQQQPVYMQPPVVMQQPPPQWSPHQQQFPSANAAYDNPNYGTPSAPPPQYPHNPHKY